MGDHCSMSKIFLLTLILPMVKVGHLRRKAAHLYSCKINIGTVYNNWGSKCQLCMPIFHKVIECTYLDYWHRGSCAGYYTRKILLHAPTPTARVAQ